MADHQEKEGLGFIRLLIITVLSLLLVFLLLFFSITIAALVNMNFSNEDLVKTIEYCHSNGLGVSTQKDSRGNILTAQCDPDVEWNP